MMILTKTTMMPFGVDVVFFLLDSEDNFTFYNEILHHLEPWTELSLDQGGQWPPNSFLKNIIIYMCINFSNFVI